MCCKLVFMNFHHINKNKKVNLVRKSEANTEKGIIKPSRRCFLRILGILSVPHSLYMHLNNRKIELVFMVYSCFAAILD